MNEKSSEHSLAGQYLTFQLSVETYGLQIKKVREIIGMMEVTSLPRMPAFMKGVVNLRGSVIPVIDLRLKFGMREIEYGRETCIIMVEVFSENSDGRHVMGLVVDRVDEVINVQTDQIEPPPEFGSQVSTDFILGIARTENNITILLDVDRILSREENRVIESAGSNPREE